jgi:hypothetical protein
MSTDRPPPTHATGERAVDLVGESLGYLRRSDRVLRTVAIGGVLTFVVQAALASVLLPLATGRGVGTGGGFATGLLADLDPDGVVLAIAVLGVASFVLRTGFYVRVTERVVAGEAEPPAFTDGARLVSDGGLFVVTALALIAGVLALQAIAMVLAVVAFVFVETVLGVAVVGAVIGVLSVIFAVLLALAAVYPQPSVVLLVARFRVRHGSTPSYIRFVTSRQVASEFVSTLFSRRYALGWVLFLAISVLQGTAVVAFGSSADPASIAEFAFQLNNRLVVAFVDFYASVAIVHLFASLFPESESDRDHQTSLGEFDAAGE